PAASLDPVGEGRHHPGRKAHRGARRRRELARAEALRALAVARLVAAHGLDQGARARIAFRQRREVTREVLLDLALGLGEEREIPAIPGGAGGRADGQRARVPERIEQARPPAELADARGAPGEVVFLLARRALEGVSVLGAAGRQGLALVERLRADFAHVVDAHQRGGVRTLALVQLRL